MVYGMNIKSLILIITAVVAVIITFGFVEPLPQDPGYHNFADQRTFWGIPNTLDSLSNIPLAIVGFMGIFAALKRLRSQNFNATVFQYLIFFMGVFLTGFGSLYYHLAPSNETLIWDRLPITILSIGFFCSVISEMVSPKASLVFVGPLLLIGIGSVLYWNYTESLGHGDLRLYGIVQFLPLILIVLIFVMYKFPENYLPYIIGLLIFYTLSRLTEFFDQQIYATLQFISGHTLKHLFASAAACCILIMLKNREFIQS
jgi:hypothetical protein